MLTNPLVHIGTVVGAHGIKGEVKIRSFVEDFSLFSQPEVFDKSGKNRIFLKVTGKAKDAVIALLNDICDRNQAEQLKGTDLFVPAKLLPETKDGEFYHSEILGLEARLENGDVFGKVASIENFGAGDIIEVTKPSGDAEMLPFSAPWVGEINIEQGFIVITPAEYL